MELTLNLGWALLALWMIWAWLHTTPPTTPGRRVQVVGLAMAILILLPAISMTDDLVAAQNPAEIDCCARRTHDHGDSNLHSLPPAVAFLPAPAFAGTSLVFAGMTAIDNLFSPFVENPALKPIENRPPPAA